MQQRETLTLSAATLPPSHRGHNPNLTLYTYDPTKAKSLLREAGYPDGFEITIICPEAHVFEVQVMKEDV